jgi:hypothetical protein
MRRTTVASELGPEQREQQLAALRRKMGRALRRKDGARVRALAVEYEALKGEHVRLALEEHKARVRAARAQREAQQQGPARRGRVPWSRGRHGRSPAAVERDRWAKPEPEAPQLPRGGHLSPWRRGGSAAGEQIWRP